MKNVRIRFLQGEQTKFIQVVYAKSGLSTIQLAYISGVHRRSFIDWKKEKLTMTLTAAKSLCTRLDITLPEEEAILVSRWEKAQQKANSIGGKARFKKYGTPATPEGRRKGGIKSIVNLRKNGIVPIAKNYQIPKKLTEELAEFVGILLGDGGITPGQCAVTLNREADKEYVGYVAALGKKLFGEEPKKFYHKHDKAVILYYHGTLLIQYLLSLGLKIGSKVKQQVGIPDWINASQQFKIACLRGLMDTDGGVFLHTYSVNKKKYHYKTICFTNRSMPLLLFVFDTLQEMNFTPKLIHRVENKKVWLYNAIEVERYLQVIGTSNARLLRHNKI